MLRKLPEALVKELTLDSHGWEVKNPQAKRGNATGRREPVSQERLSQSLMQERSEISRVLGQFADSTKASGGNLSWEVFTAF